MKRVKTSLPLRPARPKPPHGTSKSNAPCIFFARGACRNGQACSFAHDNHHGTPATVTAAEDVRQSEAPKTADPSDSRSQIPCRFDIKGGCLKGNVCPFLHSTPKNNCPGPDKVLDDSHPEPTGKPDSWTREIGGALVQFGDGIAIVKTSLPSDFSAIHMSMIPPDSSPSSVSKLLAELGFQVPEENIRVPPRPNMTHATANIRVEDPTFAKRVHDALAKASDPKIKVAVVNAPMPRGSSLQRVECKKVHCSWQRQLRTVWLNFEEEITATKVQAKFSAGAYTVCGQKVRSSDVMGSRRRGNTQAWTVMLTEVPGEATKAEVAKTIPTALSPVHTEMGIPSLVYDMETANELVKSKLAEFGALDWWEAAAKFAPGKRAKAKARFQNEGVAFEAATALNGWTIPLAGQPTASDAAAAPNEWGLPQEYGSTSVLNIEAMYAARFKVASRIFSAVESAVEELRPSWLAKHVFLTPYKADGANPHVALRLEGADKAAVVEAKRSMEKILAGQTAVDAEGQNIWTRSFAVSGSAFQRLKQLEETLGIVIVRNKRLFQLQLFGPADKCEEAQGLLVSLAAEDPSTLHTISLTTPDFEWACLGGFRGLHQLLGHKVNFDIMSTPKQILVTGTDADYRLALEAIASRKQPTPSSTDNQPPRLPEASDAADCSICWTPADQPLVTPCGHTYCTSCFEDLCFAASSNAPSESHPPVRCEGAVGKCHAALSLSALQDLLPSHTTFEDVLAAVFSAHVRQHPGVFRSCPTADCDQLYRVSNGESSGVVFTCQACLTAVCTGCHASPPHRGLSCAAYKSASKSALADGGRAALDEVKKKLGVRDCGKCGTSMEKVDGCDHVTCGGCRTHICWRCGETFGTADKCYAHLNKKHGGIFTYEDM